MPAEFRVEHGDVIRTPADLLLLKHAQQFYGVDKKVATLLIAGGRCAQAEIQPRPGDFVVVETGGAIAARRVLFGGTARLRGFGYPEMYQFARRAVQTIADQRLPVRTLSTTIHGVNYGLDGGEALQSLALGFQQGLATRAGCPIERITFVEQDERLARVLGHALRDLDLPTPVQVPVVVPAPPQQATPIAPPAPSPQKQHIFVAMAFAEEFQDVYEFGIYEPVRRCGYICEKVNEVAFTGDILQQIKDRIRSAKYVIADLTGARPNVYLEVGYAWGHNVPVILLARKDEQLHFDVTTHNCLFYTRIGQLAKDLEALLRRLSE